MSMDELPWLIDTHCHFEGVVSDEADIAAAKAAHVRVIAIGGGTQLNLTAQQSGLDFAQGFDWSNPQVAPVPLSESICAVGELGFDFHLEQGPEVIRVQQATFEWQAAYARKHHLPIIVHTREADTVTVDALRMAALPEVGVIHSYTGNCALAKQFLDLGYYISLSGIVTFRNADALREVAKYLPSDRMLVETDSPYLAPVPKRGQRNQPQHVRYTAAFIAGLRGVALETFAEVTTANAMRLFNLS